MPIDHESHRIRIKAVSDKLGHPMTYNDAGAPRESFVRERNRNENKDRRASATESVPLLK